MTSKGGLKSKNCKQQTSFRIRFSINLLTSPIIHDNSKKADAKTLTSETTTNADFIHLDSTSTSYHSLSVDPKLFKTEKDIYWNLNFHIALNQIIRI